MKESEKIYQLKVIGSIGTKEISQLVCINDDGSDFVNKKQMFKEKYYSDSLR
jgi:hypothetical protein